VKEKKGANYVVCLSGERDENVKYLISPEGEH
jgi:hypothetical protein